LSLEDVVARLQAGEPRAALLLLESEHSTSIDPNVLYLTGVCRYELRDVAGALEAFERAIGLAPTNADWLHASALACEDLQRPEEALERYSRAIAVAANHADAWHNRGLLLAKLGRREEALRSHQNFVRALPSSARAHADLADILLSLEHYSDALRAADAAIELDPQSQEAMLTAGLASAMLEQFEQSSNWFIRAKQADPAKFGRYVSLRLDSSLDRDLDPRSIRLIRGFDKLQACEWHGYAHYAALFESAVKWWAANRGNLPSPPLVFRSLAVPLSIATRRDLANAVAHRLGGIAQPGIRKPATSARIRLGYVSPDFGTHPTGILSSPLFELHNRSRFEVHAFSLRPDDGSKWRRHVRGHADQFHDLDALSLAEVQQRVRSAAMDILVDLAGITTGAQPELFAQRAAPIQVSYLGFPGTSGHGLADYLICDPICVPAGEEHGYSEAIVRLPHTFWLCNPGELPSSPPRRSLYGLPNDAFVLYAHHPGQKITPHIFAVWMRILRAVPYAVLWLLADHPQLPANLRREAAAHGIGAHRLIFAARAKYGEYRQRIPLANLALDTPIYNGGATTLDALSCGLPVLSCIGNGFAGRMAASALTAADLADLVVPDLNAYQRKAIELARQRDTLADVRQRVLQARQSSRLFDVEGRVRQLEGAYEGMLARSLT
jgi:protein O-GlcNAc transferase